MAVIIFVRHGESTCNTQHICVSGTRGAPLTALGKKGARATASELKKLKVSAVYTSPVLRARQTAQIISNAVRIPVLIDERLHECTMGPFEGKKLGGRFPDIETMRLVQEPKGVEKFRSILSRTKSFSSSARRKRGIIIAVTHLSVVQSVASMTLGLKGPVLFGMRPAPATMTVLHASMNGYKILGVGLSFLPPEMTRQIRRWAR